MADLISMLAAASGVGGEYEIERSLRFNSADSAYLNRTPSSTGNRRTLTFSAWVKLSSTSTDPFLIGAGTGGQIWIVSNILRVRLNGSPDYYYDTSAVLRDFSAWYHIVVAVDTTNATSADRVKIYINGIRQTIGASNAPPQNFDTEFNLASTSHQIGKWPNGSQYLNGYMTEIHFIDGQALTPSSFGEINADTGVWSPIRYAGTYGTNGFYLNFSDNSNTTAGTLGKDYSPNGNNWTPNNFSVTAGAGNDSLVDSPTRYGTDTGAGGEVRGNYATLNAVDNQLTLANGNLQFDRATNSWRSTRATVGITSGKWYWEVTPTAVTGTLYCMVGVAKDSATLGDYFAASTTGWAYSAHDGGKYNNATYAAYGNTFTTNDVIGIAFDADTGEIKFYKNNTVQNSGTAAYTGLTSGPYIPAVSLYGTATAYINFGQRPFAYTAPSGFKALCTTNLPDPTIVEGNDYFNTVLYTGNGGNLSVTGVGFQPDLNWIKSRSNGGTNHLLEDVIRGTKKSLLSNSTSAELNRGISSFDSDGFSFNDDGAGDGNFSGYTYVAWNWKANGAGSSNTAGTITSTVSVNTTSGFSIVTYTGTGSAATVGHGLGAVPRMIIVKNRDAADAWQVYHAANTANPETDYLVLNDTAATADAADRWNDTLPTSTVFSIGNGVEVNTNTEKYVAYCFAPVAGFSAFGSYTGNGNADGPFAFLGFRPAFVMLKRTDSTSNWTILDFKREGYNVDNDPLFPNLSNAEGTTDLADLLSNGFKLRSTDASVNASTATYIYAAFATSPFKLSLAR